MPRGVVEAVVAGLGVVTCSRSRAHKGGQHRADRCNVSLNLAVERRDPAVRASVAAHAQVTGDLFWYRAPPLKLVHDVRPGSACAEQAAQTHCEC